MMINKTVFVSKIGFADAEFQAKMTGYRPVGRGRNKKGEFIVFGRKGGF